MSIVNRLNIRTATYGPSSTAGHGSLTPADIAGQLGMLKDVLGAQLIVFRDNHDQLAGANAVLGWKHRIREIAAAGGWRSKEPERWDWLAEGTLKEHLLDQHVCPACDGAGILSNVKVRATMGRYKTNGKGERVEEYVYVRRNITCDKCEGSGEVTPRIVDRARQLHVDQASFKQTWLPRWEELLLELKHIEGMSRQELRRGLR